MEKLISLAKINLGVAPDLAAMLGISEEELETHRAEITKGPNLFAVLRMASPDTPIQIQHIRETVSKVVPPTVSLKNLDEAMEAVVNVAISYWREKRRKQKVSLRSFVATVFLVLLMYAS